MKKEKDDYIEVPDGQKGRILPFELVQKEMFADQLDVIRQMEQQLAQTDDEIQNVVEEFIDEETETYVTDEKLDTAKVKADEKTKGRGVNPNVDPATREKLHHIVDIFDKQSALKKTISFANAKLLVDTVSAIENLTDEQAADLLHAKWITPIFEGISDTLSVTFNTLGTKVSTLVKKYAVSYTELNAQLAKEKNELSSLIDELTGDEFTMTGFVTFKESLKSE